jgi:hypothetical protein
MRTYKVTVTEEATKWYNENYRLHREDGPAIEHSNGDKSYYINGELHRENGAALEWADGDKAYYINDQFLTKEEFDNRYKYLY